jgi:hypothetical protein
MLIKCMQKEIFINADLVTRVVNNGQDGLLIFYAGKAEPEPFDNHTSGDVAAVSYVVRQLREDNRFLGLGAGPHGPSEYVNFNHVRQVILEGEKATVYFLNEQKTYQGRDYDALAYRVGSRSFH